GFVWPRQHGFPTRVVLAASLLAQKRNAEPNPRFRAGNRALRRQPGGEGAAPTPPASGNLFGPLGGLGRPYDEWDKPEQAAKWRKELEAARAAQPTQRPERG